MADDCIECLLHGQKLSDSDFNVLTVSLHSKKVEELQKIVTKVSVRLTGFREHDIIDRLVGMAKIGATHKPCDDANDSEAILSISYITDEVKQVLCGLPEFYHLFHCIKEPSTAFTISSMVMFETLKNTLSDT